MASNSFGTLLRMTSWGESHGPSMGVIIDGCPAGLPLTQEEVQKALRWRAPGQSPYTSPRKETDQVEILSGLFEGKTTGAPLAMQIANRDADPSKYEPIKDLLRPGHANYTYLEKYGTFDYRGGGRASARETVCRVAAGAVAERLLKEAGIHLVAYIKELGGLVAPTPSWTEHLEDEIYASPLFCPCPHTSQQMQELISTVRAEGDSLGAIVEATAYKLPAGLGDPVFEKLSANLAKAMMSIPATKGFEIGEGFAATRLRGSQHNDAFTTNNGSITTTTNHAGGVLGGISTGMPLTVRVAFKPTSSIARKQNTVDREGQPAELQLPPGSRHDPCVAIRGVAVVKAMMAWTIADALLMQNLTLKERSSRAGAFIGGRGDDYASLSSPRTPSH